MSSQVASNKNSVKASKKSESKAVAASVADQESVNTVKATGRWTRDEHYRFLEALKLYGKEWKKV